MRSSSLDRVIRRLCSLPLPALSAAADCRGWIALMAEMRLNKIIADAGVTSRRGADELIESQVG
jgi:hypothetical protein